MKIDPEILKALAVAVELAGATMSESAIRVFAQDLAPYPRDQVLNALTRCRRELRGRITLHDVISRIQENDGRLGAEEAWALMPKTEADSAVITQEMAIAFGACSGLIGRDDVAARMAFKEAYHREVAKAREMGTVAQWFPSLGHDPSAREQALRAAFENGRLGVDRGRRRLR